MNLSELVGGALTLDLESDLRDLSAAVRGESGDRWELNDTRARTPEERLRLHALKLKQLSSDANGDANV